MCTKSGLYGASLLPITRSTLTTLAETTTKLTLTRSTKSLVSTTTTQLGSSEMTTMMLETTNGATAMMLETAIEMAATKRSTKTTPGRTTLHQLSSSEMASWRITTLKLTSSLGTVAFVQEMRGIIVNLGMMVRVLVTMMILSVVFMKTPFKREIKRMMSKRKTTTTSSAPEF